MKVSCSNCGEELLGSVNRCWKCGTGIQPLTGDLETPPIRRAPIPDLRAGPEPGVEQALEAEVLVESDLAGGEETPEAAASVAASDPPDVVDSGEPEAAALATVTAAAPAEPSPVSAGRRAAPRRVAGRGGYHLWLGVASLACGLVAAGLAFTSLWALIVSFFGLSLGIWAVMGERRGPAMVGILICCAAFSVSGYRGLVAAYTAYTGYSPFDYGNVDDSPIEEPDDFGGLDDEW